MSDPCGCSWHEDADEYEDRPVLIADDCLTHQPRYLETLDLDERTGH
jgi:hypothetical protein